MTEQMPWPKGELVRIGGPERPLSERIQRYRANVLAIREAGHAVPSAMADTLDEAEIEAWIKKSDATVALLEGTIRRVSELPDDTTFPSPLI